MPILKRVTIFTKTGEDKTSLLRFIKSNYYYDDQALSYIVVICKLEEVSNLVSDCLLYNCVSDINVVGV